MDGDAARSYADKVIQESYDEVDEDDILAMVRIRDVKAWLRQGFEEGQRQAFNAAMHIVKSFKEE
jgi:hypothetical protein